ncbi:MAG: hypothetical protein VYA55_13475 [Pseudomonadota bacterium]|nr:hypothetical protein [Pseudomonadota bacterium]
MNRQRGQAMSEFLVYMAWLIPFTFMAVAIVQMIKVQTQTHKAARYVAWERTAYSGAEYQDRLTDPINGFDDEVATRFFLQEESGFDSDGGITSGRWTDRQSRQSIVDLDNGIRIREPDTNDTFINDATGFLESNSSRVNWLQERSDVELNAIAAASLQVDFDAENAYALTPTSGFTPHVDASYVLIADSWAPGNESAYSERVRGVRESVYSNAQRWYQNTQATRFLAPIFNEIDEKLFVNGSDSFDMVSGSQSVEVPESLLEPYVAP